MHFPLARKMTHYISWPPSQELHLLSESKKDQITHWQGKKTILLVTHREDYIKLSDKVIYMKAGLPPAILTPNQYEQMTTL
jgi:ABC-type transport system involved in cytochrome bd biosynthesis fused ATPase/permease subunit